MRKLIALLALALSGTAVTAQQPLNAEGAKALLRQQAIHLPLSEQDLNEAIVSAAYRQNDGNYAMIYLHQGVAGIEVFNRILSIHARPDFTRAAGAFLPKAATLIQPANALPKMLPAEAVKAMLASFNVAAEPTVLAVENNGKKYYYDKGNFAWEKVQVKLQWNSDSVSQQLQLCWEVTLPLGKDGHLYQWALSTNDLSVVRKTDLTISCAVDGHDHRHPLYTATDEQLQAWFQKQSSIHQVQQTSNSTGTQYLVSPYPAESPLHPGGALALRTDPWLLSPAGSPATSLQWHSNGSTVFSTTRGNNVHAQEDRDAFNSTLGQAGNSTSALPALTFNPSVNFTNQPITPSNQQGALVNLFYWNNILHDISYLYGFHELAGNFQVSNQGRGGLGSDAVVADAQDAGGFNNANMNVPVDGTAPRMQMYLWNSLPNNVVRVNAPAESVGNVMALEATFNTASRFISTGAKTGNLVMYTDATNGNNSQGCFPATNAAALAGNIALIQGSTAVCSNADKVLAAQAAGAIAAVVISPTGTISSMTASPTNNAIIIPSVMVSNTSGTALRSSLLAGQVVNLTLNAIMLDSDYDNGIIAHEYTHGISVRFTGGPNNSACLNNAEQMGEGWSDYYALMACTNWATTGLNDGGLRRPIGNYAQGRDIATANGIRGLPYTTNMNINNWTYATIANTGGSVHAIGAVWCAMLWDMTWKLIEMDGINANLFNPSGAGGNSVALRLVNEGMRLQPCSPGFVDGRNAILRADTLLYGGKYSCAIWQAFARRGLGWSASQGGSSNFTDGIAATDLPQGAVVRKVAQLSTISQLQEMDYQLKLRCQCSPISGFSLIDTLPANLTYVSGGTYNATNRTVSFSNISLNASDSATYTFRVRANAGSYQPTVTHINESVPNLTLPTGFVTTNTAGFNWTVSSSQSSSAPYSFFASNREDEEEKYLTSTQQFPLTRYSILSFRHSFNTEARYDGGVVEFSTNNGSTWQDAGPYMIQNGYNGQMNAATVFVLAGRQAFSGNSGGFMTTKIDLSNFAGQSVKIRFLFGSDGFVAATGWFVDDILLTSESSVRNVAMVRNANATIVSRSTEVTPINGFALPVVWQRFDAQKQQQAALLSWATAQEQNTKQFVVERSQPRGQFEAIGSKPAAGQSSRPTDYQFVDASPFAGVNLYRLRQEDIDGKISYSEVRSLDFSSRKSATLQPNPAKTMVVLDWAGYQAGEEATARLLNAQGQTMATYRLSGQRSSLSLPVGLSAGNYRVLVAEKGKLVVELPLIVTN